MKRFTLTASVLLAFSVPAVAQARVPTRQHASEYAKAYRTVAREFGRRTPGRNIMRDGFNSHRGATDADVVASLAVLQRMLAPPPVVQSVSTTSASTPASYSSSGGWVIPSAVVQCESGGQNLAPNSASAAGYYQIIKSTWAGYGGYSSANEAPKSVQDAKAAQLWNGGKGSGDWVCKG